MSNNDFKQDDQLTNILMKITTDYNTDKLQNNDLQIISSYADILRAEPGYLLPLHHIKAVKAITMILAYNLEFKGNAGLNREFFKCDLSAIEQIIASNKDLKITFVQHNISLSMVLYTEQDKIYYLYERENTFTRIEQEKFDELKSTFEGIGGLKEPLNNYLLRKIGEPINTQTITITYSDHFNFPIGADKPEAVLLYPAINTETGALYQHKLTLVMVFEDAISSVTEFHDTFQICPPHGC
ncbi:MAG TPA: hypothetical protein DCQ50_05745 [Chryseobacterium sp.]|nr:hypothetical protein [Chryseobacterium sp.]